MKKADLVAKIAKSARIPKRKAERVVSTLQDCVLNAMRKGEKVTITGFGTFSTVHRRARTGRNPQTGVPISIPRKVVPKFSPGPKLRKAIKINDADKDPFIDSLLELSEFY